MQFNIIYLIFSMISSTYGYIPSDMMDSMNTKRSACADLYKYTCGGWLEQYILQDEDTHVTSSISKIDSHINQVVQEIITMKLPILHDFWQSCRDMEILNKKANFPLSIDLRRIRKATSTKELMELAGKFARTGGSVFVKYKVGPNPLNTKFNTLLLEPELTLPDSTYYLNEDIRQKYEKYIYDLLTSAGFEYDSSRPNKKRKRISKAVPQSTLPLSFPEIVIRIEKQLADYKAQVDQMIFPIKIEDAIVSWPISFKNYADGMRLMGNNKHIKKDMMIWGSPTYLDHIESMLKALPLEELRLYISFRMIHSRALWLGRLFDGPWFSFFRNTLKGQRTHRSRDQICRDRLREYFPDLIGKHFYKKSFDEERKQTVLEMTKLIKDAMEELIDKATWLDGKPNEVDPRLKSILNTMGEPSTGWHEKSEKEKAKEKLNKLTILIGQPDVLRTYPTTLSHNNYPGNMDIIMSHSFDEEMKKVGQPRNPHEWTVSPMAINAHYIPDQNTLVLPVGLLQPPLLHGKEMHPARNFGALGSIIGHEIMHAVDARGSLYDAQGNEFPWWNTENIDYTELSKCFENQYSEKEVLGRKVNGALKRNEIIADNGGVALAWNAYRRHMTIVQPNTNGVTGQQGDRLFFFAYAQSLCERFRETKTSSINEVYPSKARVNGVAMNNVHFAQTFQCNSNSALNRYRRCIVW